MLSTVNEMQAALDLHFREMERNASGTPSLPARNVADVVDIHAPVLLTDEEADEAMASVRQTTEENPAAALNVHQGLTYNRVMQLLEGL